VNLALDWVLISHFGAVGAAWGNGLSQGFGVVVIWVLARRAYEFTFPWLDAMRIFIAAVTMGAVAFLLDQKIHGVPGLVVSIGTAIPTYLIMIKLVRGLKPSDRARLGPIGNRLPGSARRAYLAAIAFLTPVAG
jgi:peptidoglycan biosynthesis protein MviN/MurJ (putative lipid II flippase)